MIEVKIRHRKKALLPFMSLQVLLMYIKQERIRYIINIDKKLLRTKRTSFLLTMLFTFFNSWQVTVHLLPGLPPIWRR